MILNLTQHASTPGQKVAGVMDLNGSQLELLRELLTFEALPSKEEIDDRAHDIARLVISNGLGDDMDQDPIFDRAMIGGAPFLMRALEDALMEHYIQPLYAFSKREVVEEQVEGGGGARKVAVFRHLGFVSYVVLT